MISTFKVKRCCSSNVPVFIYKKLSDIVIPPPPICEMFNTSVVERFPDNLKIARVVPIFKSDDKHDVSNYRRISTFPVLSKIFEKLMHKRLISFLHYNNIICKYQFGFQLGYSTDDAILEFLDYLYTALKNKMYIMPVYLDFSKSFDTVNHEILCQKLHNYSIRGVVLDWFTSYLSNRKKVCIASWLRL